MPRRGRLESPTATRVGEGLPATRRATLAVGTIGISSFTSGGASRSVVAFED